MIGGAGSHARTLVRAATGRRDHLRRGYLIRTRPDGQTVRVTVRRPGWQPIRFETFPDRLFLLDEFVLRDQYLNTLRRLRPQLAQRAIDGRLWVIDAGANIGLFSLFASRIMRLKLHVVGFEPLPENQRLCERNWAALDHQLRPEALSDQDNPAVPLYVHSSTSATISRKEAVGDPPWVTVQTARLDSLNLTLPRIDLVKLDIEGAEEWALAGGADTLRRHRPFIICSYEHSGNDRRRLRDVAGPGYTVTDEKPWRLLLFTPTA